METVIRGAAVYFIVLIVVRLSGRRTMAQMTPFDFVLLLIAAETTQQALLGDDFSIINATILLVTLFAIDIGLSHLKRLYPRMGTIIDGAPTILIRDGTPDHFALDQARVGLDDLMEAARNQQGLEHLDQIKFAVLEVGGSISIIPKKPGVS